MITRPVPVLNPVRIGDETRSARKPSRRRPTTSRTTPTMMASADAAANGSLAPLCSMADAVRSEMVDVVLTLNGREVPSTA
jgi:hypothetical protein